MHTYTLTITIIHSIPHKGRKTRRKSAWKENEKLRHFFLQQDTLKTLEDYPWGDNHLEVEHLCLELLGNGRARDTVYRIIYFDTMVQSEVG